MRRNHMKNLGKRLLSLTMFCVLITISVGGCASPTAVPTAVPQNPVATAVPTTAPAGPVATVAPKSLNIGDIETLTGASSDNLKLAASGSYLAQQYINKHGGITINGEVYMVNIMLEDNKGT